MNRKLLGICGVGLTLCNCAAAPRDEPRSAPQDYVLDNHRKPRASIEAPRRLISSMQACADPHAPKIPGASFAVLFELEV